LRALVQPLTPALDGGEELVEVDLERREDPVRPVLHLEPCLARLPACVGGGACTPSRPRLTAVRNLSSLTSRVERIPSAQSSISSRVSRACRRASSTISCAWGAGGSPVSLRVRPRAAR